MTPNRKTAPRRGSRALALVAAGVLALAAGPLQAESKTAFTIGWSVYVGAMPWGYMADHGIMEEWAERYGIEVEIVRIDGHARSLDQYAAGAFDGVSTTNIDLLSLLAGGGVDSTALIVGGYSNGADAILAKGEGATLADLAGRPVSLSERSASRYLLVRALETAGLAEADLGAIVATSDDAMASAWQSGEIEAAVARSPRVAPLLATGEAARVADSSAIPGEIIDLLAVNTEVLEDNPAFGKAVVGAWYETLALMSADRAAGEIEAEDGAAAAAARAAMGEAAGTDRAGYEAQLALAAMFFKPTEAVAFVENPALIETMRDIARFLADRRIAGPAAPSPVSVGVAYPSGQLTGDAENLKFRFSVEYMKMAADGLL